MSVKDCAQRGLLNEFADILQRFSGAGPKSPIKSSELRANSGATPRNDEAPGIAAEGSWSCVGIFPRLPFRPGFARPSGALCLGQGKWETVMSVIWDYLMALGMGLVPAVAVLLL